MENTGEFLSMKLTHYTPCTADKDGRSRELSDKKARMDAIVALEQMIEAGLTILFPACKSN
jgi:hypothetical protein